MVLAFDTPPLATNCRALRDYTSLHLYSAAGLQLFRFEAATSTLVPSACRRWRMSADATEHAFRVAPSEGVEAGRLAANFARGIAAAVDAGAPAGRRFDRISDLGVRSLADGDAELFIRLAQPDRRVAYKLAHPSFAAESAPGPFHWDDRGERGGRLLKQCESGSEESLHLEYRVFDDPDTGVDAYERGEVDTTCPVLHSAATLKRLLGRCDLVESRSNTFMVLFPVSPVALEPHTRRALRDRLDIAELAHRFAPGLSPVSGFSRLSEPKTTSQVDGVRMNPLGGAVELPPLTLAYDPFPPNRDVLKAIGQLCYRGIRLVTDNFAAPSAACDFRLVVLVNSHAYDADAYRMVGQTAAVRGDPTLHDRWWREIAAFDAAKEEAGRAAAIRVLDDLLTDACPAILLARLNAYHLQRPCLGWLDFASDASWERSW